MSDTKIEWCQNPDGTKGKTWNPTTGCTKISAGCLNCYAARMARRQQVIGNYPNGFDVTLWPERLKEPSGWQTPQRVFFCSMGDLLHEEVPDNYIRRVWSVVRACPQHTFMLLTKRPERLADLKRAGYNRPCNLWLGVTVENQETIIRVSELAMAGEAKKFISFEPLLERIEVFISKIRLVDWVIVGCETGPGCRPCKLEWIEEIIERCDWYAMPIFVKQLDIDGRISKDMSEWPEWAQRREFPK